MAENMSRGDTQSINDVIQQIEKDQLILPEFQRDFVWDLTKSIDLFDSLSRGIYIGSVIYGSPTTGIAYRSIRENERTRRKGNSKHNGSKKNPTVINDTNIDDFEARGVRLILDGQQRLTALYRAIKGSDTLWCVGKDVEQFEDGTRSIKDILKEKSLEQLMEKFSTDEEKNSVCVKISDAYDMRTSDDDDKIDRFKQSQFYMSHPEFSDERLFEPYKRLYLAITRELITLFNGNKVVSYHLLNMKIDKFALFFERSNSKSVPLTFVDILVAKLYAGNFNLRESIEAYNTDHQYKMKPEIAIRAIAYLVSKGKNIEKEYILKSLSADDFRNYWNDVVTFYDRAISYLVHQNYILDIGDLPYDNILIPLILFQYHLKPNNIDAIESHTAKTLDWWYWSVAFSRHYSGSSNEAIRKDAKFLIALAAIFQNVEKNQIPFTHDEMDNYFSELKPVISSADDVKRTTVTRNPLYFGFMGLLRKVNHGQINWNNNANISGKLDSHHIFPSKYLKSKGYSTDSIDRIANRILIEKITNIRISDRAPSAYLKEIEIKNVDLKSVLQKLAIPPELLDGVYDDDYEEFMTRRSQLLFDLVDSEVFGKTDDIKSDIRKSFNI